MNKTIVVFFLFAFSLKVTATDQQPDKLFYKNLTLTLNTGWGHPSPLQTYFYQNNINYPFTMISTGNYRGHIATWGIENDQFYLKEIHIKEKKHSPNGFGIKSKEHLPNDTSVIFAEWFSGIIECNKTDEKDRWKTISTFYFQVRHGKIISTNELTKNDFEKVCNISRNDTADKDLMNKYQSLSLNQNYITYYYRLNENDRIRYNNRDCRLNTGVSRLGPIYSYYLNQHLNWPYNWENLESCGAPNCTWKIVNDSLILTDVQLYGGLSFDSIGKTPIKLDKLFPELVVDNQVFAGWVSGIQLIIFGIDTSYGFGYKEFKPKEYTYCRIEKGIVKETYSVPQDFDMRKNDDSLDPGLKKLMKDY